MSCGCKQHDIWATDKPFQVLKLSWRKIKRGTVEGLIAAGYLSSKNQYLCTACADWFEQQSSANKSATDIAVAIRNGQYSTDDLRLIAEAIGERISQDVLDHSQNICQDYQDAKLLQTYQAALWLQHVNPVLVAFLATLCQINLSAGNIIKINALALAVEQIYYCRNSNLIAPLSFANNLMVYYLTGSKSACNVISTSRPAASYHSILQWIDNQSQEPVTVSGEGDIVTFFDNSQVLARNWRIRYDAKAMVSVITTLLHIFPGNEHSLQTQEQYNPSGWHRFDVQHLRATLPSFLSCDLSLFRHYRAHVISHMIESVMSEQKCSTSGCRDDYDQHQLPESTSAGTEASYRAVFDESSTKIRIIRSDSIAHRYSLVEAGSLIAPDLVVGEPVLVNPCSYAAMHVVLKRIIQDSGIGVSRSWVVVGCDGLPYNLASRVICRTFNCPLCDRRDISGCEEFKGHVLREHTQTIPDAADHRTYGSILLVPGPGHMEINMTKATFKLLWHVVLQDLAKLLGFRSAKAQASCQNASDHHKAWQMIEVLFWGTGAELIVPYVRECQRSGIRPDVAGFGEWLSNRTDKNFVFLADVMFTYVMALFLFRCGIRRGNHSLALQSFSRFSDLFFGLNMTQYQELSLRYHHTLRSCPDVIHTFLKDNLSYSVSGADDRGEGGDFILEAKNRRLQMWMPPGLPTSHHWQRICRNLDTLDSIRDHLTTTTSGSHHVDLSRETRHWRHHLRQSAYLGTTMSTRPHVSLGAKALDLHLSSFATTCQDNKTQYVEETTHGQPLGSHHQLQRVFVLAGEREEASDVTKKTNSQLCGLIVDTIGRIHDAGADQLADSLRQEYMKDVRTGTKAVLLTFLQRAGDTLTEVLELEESQGRAEDAPGQ